MMRYITIKEMRAAEAAAITTGGVTAALLMERAGQAVAREAKQMSAGGPVTILCGYGNNGGDGFVAARYLLRDRFAVRVFLVGGPRAMSAEAGSNYDTLLGMGCPISVIVQPDGLAPAMPVAEALAESILIIDAIFGVGCRSPLDTLYVRLIEMVNASGKPILAVDLPSGFDADTGQPLPVAIKATKTVTLGYPKAGFRKDGAALYIGELVVADIGL